MQKVTGLGLGPVFGFGVCWHLVLLNPASTMLRRFARLVTECYRHASVLLLS